MLVKYRCTTYPLSELCGEQERNWPSQEQIPDRGRELSSAKLPFTIQFFYLLLHFECSVISPYSSLSIFCQILTYGDNYLLASPVLEKPLMAETGPVPSVINTYIIIFTLLIDKVISIMLGHTLSTLYFAHRALHLIQAKCVFLY